MNHILIFIAIPISIVIAIVFVIKLRRSNQNTEEKLTSIEKIVFTLAMLSTGLSVLYYILLSDITIGQLKAVVIVLWLPQTIIVGSILYYGLKKHFPIKARQILFIERVVIGIILLLMIGGYFFVNHYLAPKLQAEFETILDQQYEEYKLLEEQKKKEEETSPDPWLSEHGQRANLRDRKFEKFENNTFTLMVPEGWQENTSTENVKRWETADRNLTIEVVWEDNLSDSDLNIKKEKEVAIVKANPVYNEILHPNIKNALESYFMFKKEISTPYMTLLYIYGDNYIYRVNTMTWFDSEEEIEALKEVMLSFEIKN
ncbi:MAG: hypothetical protein KAS07_02995 [Candidatus Pacebacteria bacterium]|nr:hypothetical protein [Candidatus Paceibacterota bacterium]